MLNDAINGIAGQLNENVSGQAQVTSMWVTGQRDPGGSHRNTNTGFGHFSCLSTIACGETLLLKTLHRLAAGLRNQYWTEQETFPNS